MSGPTFLVRPPEEWPKDSTNGDFILSHDPDNQKDLVKEGCGMDSSF